MLLSQSESSVIEMQQIKSQTNGVNHNAIGTSLHTKQVNGAVNDQFICQRNGYTGMPITTAKMGKTLIEFSVDSPEMNITGAGQNPLTDLYYAAPGGQER